MEGSCTIRGMTNEIKEGIRRDDKSAIGNDFNITDECCWGILHYAAQSGSLNITKFLVNDQGVSFNTKNEERNKPIHIAADEGKEEIVKFFLDKGIEIDTEGKGDYTPLHYAAEKGNENIVELLVERGANIYAVNSDEKTPLQLAGDKRHYMTKNLMLNKALLSSVKQGDRNKVAQHIGNGANINHSDFQGWTLLHHAANRTVDDENFIKFLVEKGANINATTNDEDKPLHIASSRTHVNIVSFFIGDKGIAIDDQGKDKWTPLHHAVNKDSEAFVEFLIKKGASIYVKDYNNTTPLQLANDKRVKPKLLGKALIDAVNGNYITKAVDYIKKGANVDYSYEDRKWTPLHYAASLGYRRSAEVLIKNNATIIDAKDFEDSNPLHIAAEYGHKNIVEFFLKSPRGALNESKDKLLESEGKNGWTLLHYATDKGRLEVVKFLIETGANIAAKDFNDKTPLQLAEKKGNSHKEVAKLLRSREFLL